MEVAGLEVVVVEHLGEYLRILAVAPGVLDAAQVGVVPVLPASAVEFRAAAAAFRVAGVADFASVSEHLAPGLVYGLAHGIPDSHREALVALAVVVGAHVEAFVRQGRLRRVRSGETAPPVVNPERKPAAGDHRMGLEQLKRGAGLHLGGDDAEQVVLHPDAVHGGEHVVLHYELQAAGELERALLLPVEVLAYHHVMKYEGGLGEQGRARDRVEVELVVEHAVVGYTAVAPAHPLGAGAVGDDLEDDLPRGKYAHGYQRLAAGEPPFYHGLLVRVDCHLGEQAAQQFGGGLVEVLPERSDEHSGDVGCAGADGQVVLAFGVVVVRALPGAHDHECAVFAFLAVGVEVELRLYLPFRPVGAVQQAVEQLGERLGGGRLEGEDSVDEAGIAVERGVLDRGEGFAGAVKESVDRLLEREMVPGYRLEMQVVGGGGSAGRSVVEHQIVRVPGGEVQHVREMVPYRLRQVFVTHDDQMAGEDGIGVDLYVVEPALPALELEVELLRRAVFLAEEALSRRDGLGGGVRGRGDDPDGVVLYAAGQPADLQTAVAQAFERPEVGRRKRPDGKLVLYEFLKFVGHSRACSIRSIMAYSDSKLGVNTPFPRLSLISDSVQ